MARARTTKPLIAARPADAALLSSQVSGSRYFFLDPAKRARGGGLVLGGREHCNPDYRIDRRSFAYHVVEFASEGAGWVKLAGGAKEMLEPGCVFVSRRTSACEMGVDAQRPMAKYFLCFSGDAPLRRLARAGLKADRVTKLAASGDVRSVLEDLIREGKRPGPRAAEICAVLFDLLLLKIADAMPRGRADDEGPARENFLRCKALIDARAEKLATLEEVAAEARLDVSSVCRLFRRFQGVSPYQYLLRRKMNLAAEHLVDGGALVKEVAQRVGFADPFHFSRCFKAVHGMAPSQLHRGR